MSNSKNLVEIDPEKLGGTPVFYGTRVPIQNLLGLTQEPSEAMGS
jgi:uncharacterized protein (DUF433 family)